MTRSTCPVAPRRRSAEPADREYKARRCREPLARSGSVRYMSVTTATRRRVTAHGATMRDNEETARRPRYTQARGRFRW